jgi:hypothetical protein
MAGLGVWRLEWLLSTDISIFTSTCLRGAGLQLRFVAVDSIAATGAGAPLAWAALAIGGGVALAWRKPALRGTTLLAPWYWSALSLAAILATEIILAAAQSAPPQPWTVPMRFAAAMTVFCPTLALLGAKRPQDWAWQFIVFALWAILSLPSFEWLLFGVQEMHPARFWFLTLLAGTGALNGTATRFWLSSWLVGVGQMALVMPYFAATQDWLSESSGPQLGLAAIVIAWGFQAAGLPRGRAAAGLDRVWLDFRDAFGVVWGLRVAERVNATAAMVGWPATLGWRGFRGPDGLSDGVSEMTPAVVEEVFRGLLRRFVSPEWIDERLGVLKFTTAEINHQGTKGTKKEIGKAGGGRL